MPWNPRWKAEHDGSMWCCLQVFPLTQGRTCFLLNTWHIADDQFKCVHVKLCEYTALPGSLYLSVFHYYSGILEAGELEEWFIWAHSSAPVSRIYFGDSLLVGAYQGYTGCHIARDREHTGCLFRSFSSSTPSNQVPPPNMRFQGDILDPNHINARAGRNSGNHAVYL